VHKRGSLSMAHAGKDTGGSQFFICHSPQPHLDKKHTVFGQVITGLDVIDKIQPGDKMTRVWVEP
jgi:peptidyl-prolyl cis-trans isomerase B (cyclophilin B)